MARKESWGRSERRERCARGSTWLPSDHSVLAKAHPNAEFQSDMYLFVLFLFLFILLFSLSSSFFLGGGFPKLQRP